MIYSADRRHRQSEETCGEKLRNCCSKQACRSIVIVVGLIILGLLAYLVYYLFQAFSVTTPAQTRFLDECLDAHNGYREKHKSPPLVLSQPISDYALEWAKTLARRRMIDHRDNNVGQYGENLYMHIGNKSITGDHPVRNWYQEIKKYNFDAAKYTQGTGHFTQVIWKECKKLGCGIAMSGEEVYVVCNYDPPGNYKGKFSTNVLPPTIEEREPDEYESEEGGQK